ncbi:unnamed protein product [Durusdinium trenchii]|uniref:Protein kinase domain-containing protein n=2 Tax=Durusdinium trenchii TaxID=1381693 RepID=A0ABP0Q7U6_9DINO
MARAFLLGGPLGSKLPPASPICTTAAWCPLPDAASIVGVGTVLWRREPSQRMGGRGKGGARSKGGSKGGSGGFATGPLDHRKMAVDGMAAPGRKGPQKPTDDPSFVRWSKGMRLDGYPRGVTYIVEDYVASGSFSRVFRVRVETTPRTVARSLEGARNRWTKSRGEVFAAKVMRKEDSYIQYTSNGPKEGELLQRLESQQREAGLEPLTMRCVDSFPTKDDVGQEYWCLILEWLDASLFDLVRSNGNRGLHLSMVRTLLRQLLEQLKVLQDLDCTHTDIKHKNCCLVSTEHYMAPSSDGATMILSDPMAKFIDYGNAVFEGAPKPHPIHTKQFRAPEVLLKVHGGWGPASDTWTLGVTGCFLVSGQLIFNSHDPQELLRLMGQACGAFPPRLLLAAEDARMRRCAENIQAPRQPQLASWLNLDRKGPAEAACADLLLNMLALDPSERISASDALCHPFLAENGEGAKVPVPPQGQLPLRRL